MIQTLSVHTIFLTTASSIAIERQLNSQHKNIPINHRLCNRLGQGNTIETSFLQLQMLEWVSFLSPQVINAFASLQNFRSSAILALPSSKVSRTPKQSGQLEGPSGEPGHLSCHQCFKGKIRHSCIDNLVKIKQIDLK